MDIDLLKTFLEITRTRHFGQAADNLFLTQSAVSARMRLLEQVLNTPLLTRERGNIQPTPAGHKLLRHAEQILDTWNRARLDLAVQEEALAPLTIGAVPNIWDAVLQDWVHRLSHTWPELSLTAEIHPSAALIQRLQQGSIDVAFVFDAPSVAALDVYAMTEVSLIMVASRPDLNVQRALESDYVLADWGSAFSTMHQKLYPDAPAPRMRFSLGLQAYDFIRACGGAGYLAEPLVAEDLQAERLFRVADARAIARTAYVVVNASGARSETLQQALQWLGTGPAARAAGEPGAPEQSP